MVIGGYEFGEPEQLHEWDPPYRRGTYAILAVETPVAVSLMFDRYRVVYVGKSTNMSERGFENHHKRSCWDASVRPGSEHRLVATHLMPNATELELDRAERTLIQDLDPPCND